jgi:hypothetical protein
MLEPGPQAGKSELTRASLGTIMKAKQRAEKHISKNVLLFVNYEYDNQHQTLLGEAHVSSMPPNEPPELNVV